MMWNKPKCTLEERVEDANSLRARAALRQGCWSGAESHLRKIKRLNFFDKILLLRTLEAKLDDLSTRADPTLLAEVRREHDELLVQAGQTPIEIER
jgi:hypothetical protein